MSGLIKTLAGALIFVSLAGAGKTTSAAAGEPDPVPLYLYQLQQYARREQRTGSGPETEIGIFEYTVQRGDCLYGIARRFGSDVETLVCLNGIMDRNVIRTGQVIEVLTAPGSVHAVQEGETLRDIALLYGVEPGSILAVNARPAGALPARGERLIIPGGSPLSVKMLRVPDPVFCWPLRGQLTSGFGWRQGNFHYGIDLAAPLETPFYAAAPGKVLFVGQRGSYGLLVEVDHGNGWLTRYAHAGGAAVEVGAAVRTGRLLGWVGMTGNTTGPHLHFEMILNEERLDPLALLP